MAAGRRCGVCSLSTPKLLELERAVFAKTLTISQISRAYGVSPDSLYRHLRAHPSIEPHSSTPETEDLPSVANLAERLLESADDLRRARHVASVGGNILSLTRAADSEAKVIGMLIEKLGIDSTESIEILEKHQSLMVAVVGAIIRNPTFGEEVAAAFRRASNEDEAKQFEQFAMRARARNQEKELRK